MLLLALFFSAQVNAAPVDSPALDAAVDAPVARRVTRLEFTDATLKGRRALPSIGVVRARPGAHFRNLIALRPSFRPELSRSADSL